MNILSIHTLSLQVAGERNDPSEHPYHNAHDILQKLEEHTKVRKTYNHVFFVLYSFHA